MSRYEYNKLIPQPGKIMWEDDSSIIHEANEQFDKEYMKTVSIELTFNEINKKMTSNVLEKIVNKIDELGLENLIPFYIKPLIDKYSNVDENFLINYLIKDIEKSLSINKRALKKLNISKKKRKDFYSLFNVENMFKRLIEDMIEQRISI